MRGSPMRLAVLGAGNGGKATAAELALQGHAVHLWESARFAAANFAGLVGPDLTGPAVLRASGAFEVVAALDLVTTDLTAALRGVDIVFICTVAAAHGPLAKELANVFRGEGARPLIVLSPGSTGGSLVLRQAWRAAGLVDVPLLAEFGTLPYGVRASGADVTVAVKVAAVAVGVLPACETAGVVERLRQFYPDLLEKPSVLAAGLCNANPIIHPAITLLNLGAIEHKGAAHRFYRDGASPLVCRLIEALDGERMAVAAALGYAAESDPQNSKRQGYCASDESYHACYGRGVGFSQFQSPSGDGLDKHRYFSEDVGGLALYLKLAAALGVGDLPVARSVVLLANVV
ncbi:NAD/NADP octopine/nopaline dehydrogenase [Pelagophyceae sp. CCMP2097]|nr:NAD/NADP octopine/nopaline dehydrogenase [Pelagophyceae sp. CCMP2097]